MLSLLRIGLNFNNDAVCAAFGDFHKVPVAVRFLISFQFFDKQNGLLSRKSNAFFFQLFANDACRAAIENETCGEVQRQFCVVPVDRYFHFMSLHKNLNSAAVLSIYFHQIADNTLLCKLQYFIKV